MNDTYISLETAKLAKENGFDIESDKFYNEEGVLWSYYFWGEGFGGRDICFAPTQSLLQKWLREIHNLDVQSYLIEMLFNEVQQKQDLDQREYTYRIYKEGEDMYVKLEEDLSYEQALEKGLYEALKLIK